MKIALISKKNRPYVQDVINYLKKNSSKFYFINVEYKNSNLRKLLKIKPDILISYISDKIIPSVILKKTKLININFHPGPPEYPGFGCYNFALYQNSKIYGCTAHIMRKKVDTGEILDVRRFKMPERCDVSNLIKKTHKETFKQFKIVMNKIISKKKIIISKEKWTRKPFRKKDLEELCKINFNMSAAEIKKRVNATFYPNKPSAYLKLKGLIFEYNPKR